MNKYCYLSGRVNMKAVERTIQNLIGSGMDPKTENNPYLGFIYTSFQERATKARSQFCHSLQGHPSRDAFSVLHNLWRIRAHLCVSLSAAYIIPRLGQDKLQLLHCLSVCHVHV